MAMLSDEERLGERVEVDFWAPILPNASGEEQPQLQMLSLSQLRSLRDQGSEVDGRLERTIFARFSGALVNILVPAIVIPFFLLRSPAAGMLQQSLRAAAVAIPLLLGSVAAMTVAIPGLPPAVGASSPSILLPRRGSSGLPSDLITRLRRKGRVVRSSPRPPAAASRSISRRSAASRVTRSASALASSKATPSPGRSSSTSKIRIRRSAVKL